MEILTLLRANIRKKKGTFVSIMILMAIISTVTTAIFSVQDNYNKALSDAFQNADWGETTVIIKSENLSEKLCKAVETNDLVKQVDYYKALCANGAECGSMHDGNNWFLMEMRDGLRLYKEDLSGFEEEIPNLQKGEIYLPLGLKSKLSCNVGDTLTVQMIFGVTADFTIKGFVLEPAQGSMMIGWKQVFINSEDFNAVCETCQPLKTEETSLEITVLSIHQNPESRLSPTKFQRKLNLETGIVDNAIGALNQDQSMRYSTLMPDIVLDIVMVFIVLLFAIVLIVISHSISTEIEIDYAMFGILKSQGFLSGKIRLIFFLQYMLAQLVGMLVGNLAAIPIERQISSLCQSITGALPALGLSAGKSILCTALILICSVLIIFIKTHKLLKISPVRAISGGREEIYFDSRLHAPITKRGLSVSLALRQFTSGSKRYLGIIFIAALLSFSMITIQLVGNLLTSRSALSSMGVITADLLLYHRNTNEEAMAGAEKIIQAHSEIAEKNRLLHEYMSLNGENLFCEIYQSPELIPGILEGREPKYANEILITEMVGETLDLKIGDRVIVSLKNQQNECIVSGIYQSICDSGMCFAMNFEGAEDIGITPLYANRTYVLKDKTELTEIVEEIEEAYGESIAVEMYDDDNNSILEEYNGIVNLLKLIIYFFSILFAFVVVRMVCVKTFVQERKDIGIYKAIGFTSGRLRLGFAIRFFLVALCGACLGAFLSLLFSPTVLNAIFGLIGLTKLTLNYNGTSLCIPALAIGASFFLFSYFASRRIRRVEIKELVVE